MSGAGAGSGDLVNREGGGGGGGGDGCNDEGNNGGGGPGVRMSGCPSDRTGSARTGGSFGGDFRPQLRGQQLQQEQRPLLRSTSGTGLRQLASPFAPLVLDRGAVISLPSRSRARHPLPPTHTPPSSRLNPRCRSGKSSGSASGALTDDFMVELSSETTTAAIPGFPPPPPPPLQQTAATGPAAGSTAPGAAVEYAVLTCQQDVDQAVAGAAVGGDVSAAEVYTGAAAVAGAGEEGGGIVGVGGSSVLGGVEEQASGMGEREAGDVRE